MREVSPRDGLQIWPTPVATADKIRLIEAAARTGLRRIEIGSFVSPNAVPQMADSDDVADRVARFADVAFEVLVLNTRGAERAIRASVDAACIVLAASDTFNRRNSGRSVEESLREFREIYDLLRGSTTRTLATIGTAFGCPYEGDVSEDRLFEIIDSLVSIGEREIFLADTTGMAHPLAIERVTRAVLARWPEVRFGLHLHNTRGLGLANMLAGLQSGIDRFDASLGGIGGCPFAPQAAGNICTEDAVHLLHEMGIETGIDLDRLIEAARLAQSVLGRELNGQVMKAGPRKTVRAI